MTQSQSIALKVATVLWVIWGLVHFFAGVMTISQDAMPAASAILDAVDPALFEVEVPAELGGIINQHGWNLAWFGLVTIIGGVYIWRGNTTAIWVTALVGGLADIGYFLFLDLQGYVNFVPGTVMTLVSASAIILSFWVWLMPGRTADSRA